VLIIAAQSHSLLILCSPGMAAAPMLPIRMALSRRLHAPQQRVLHPVVAAAREPREVQSAREHRARARRIHKRPRRDLFPHRRVCARHGVELQKRAAAGRARARHVNEHPRRKQLPVRRVCMSAAQRAAHGQAYAATTHRSGNARAVHQLRLACGLARTESAKSTAWAQTQFAKVLSGAGACALCAIAAASVCSGLAAASWPSRQPCCAGGTQAGWAIPCSGGSPAPRSPTKKSQRAASGHTLAGSQRLRSLSSGGAAAVPPWARATERG